MNHKYKVGDSVVVSSCTERIKDMTDMIGQIVTISKQTGGQWKGQDWLAYHILEDNGRWFWREDWLEIARNVEITEDEFEAMFKDD